jgi:hypothetical protein
MKNKFTLVLGGLLLVSQTPLVSAQTALTVSASIPAATGLALTISPVTNTGTANAPVFGTALTTNTIPFGTLTFDTTVSTTTGKPLNIWDTKTYYAVDIGVAGGAGGTPVVQVTYADRLRCPCYSNV